MLIMPNGIKKYRDIFLKKINAQDFIQEAASSFFPCTVIHKYYSLLERRNADLIG